MKKNWCIFLLLALLNQVSAQNPVRISFLFLNDNAPIVLNQALTDLSGKKFKAQDIAFYMSGLKIYHDGGQAVDFGDSVFYINIRGGSILDLGVQPVNQLESIAFQVGVPEHLNHTDISAYPEDHPLFFKTPPMHWGWSAGYTFFLIDGKADTDGDLVPDTDFEIHCLGDENIQDVQVQQIATVLNDGTREIFQIVNIDQWLRNADLGTVGIQHGSNGINAAVMQNVEDYPVFTAPMNASVQQLTQPVGSLYFQQEANGLNIYWKEVKEAASFELINMQGQLAETNAVNAVNGSHGFRNLKSGTYVFRILSAEGKVLNQLNVLQP